MIWYFPLWNMGISGYEVTLLSTSAPFLLGIPLLRRITAKYPRAFHLVSLVGIAAYKVDTPRDRLLVVSAANVIQSLNWSTIFHVNRNRSALLQKDVIAFALGLTLSSVAKMSHYANNPIWPIMHGENGGLNKIALILGIAAALLIRPVSMDGHNEAARGSSTPTANWILGAFGLGGTFFALHSLLSDSSTIVLWVWDGFPIRGPLVVPHGGLTICAMLAGLYLGVTRPGVSSSWPAYATGCFGATLLYLFHGYAGFFGGLLLTTFLMAIVPSVLSVASQTPPGRTFGLGFTIYNILCLMHVWIVAYAFVPGGPILRERTDIVMIVMMLCIGCGVMNMPSAKEDNSRRIKQVSASSPGRNVSLLRTAIGAICAITFAISYVRFPTFDYVPYHAEEKLFTAGIWTVHFGLDNDMWASETRMRQIIQELELDVIGLLESDTQRIIMGNRDMTQQIAEEIGMYVDFGPGPNKHTWGAALLSKFPIINSTHHLLPSPVGELAPAIHATLDVFGTYVDVIVSHNGQEEDPEDRRLQSTVLGKIMEESPRPFVFLGYVVSRPGEYPQRYLTDNSGMNDIEPSDWDRWCEYILFRGLKRVGYARVHRSTITDTEIQTGKFVLQDPSIAPSYTRIMEEDVPEGYRYPAMFRGAVRINCLAINAAELTSTGSKRSSIQQQRSCTGAMVLYLAEARLPYRVHTHGHWCAPLARARYPTGRFSKGNGNT